MTFEEYSRMKSSMEDEIETILIRLSNMYKHTEIDKEDIKVIRQALVDAKAYFEEMLNATE